MTLTIFLHARYTFSPSSCWVLSTTQRFLCVRYHVQCEINQTEGNQPTQRLLKYYKMYANTLRLNVLSSHQVMYEQTYIKRFILYRCIIRMHLLQNMPHINTNTRRNTNLRQFNLLYPLTCFGPSGPSSRRTRVIYDYSACMMIDT